MARRRRGRDVDGVILLDKPLGCSSNAALQRVRRAFDARKAGHTGSLDPLATGLLPVCLGEATKASAYLLHADKHYRVTAEVGSETATGDREGGITRKSGAATPEAAEFDTILRRFVGAQQQIPPMYSALKKDGKRLYEHARAGREIERDPRDIEVYAVECVAHTAERFTLDVSVSGGTYIRTLVEDIARAWGGCAHVGMLRRLGVGRLGDEHSMVTLDDIEAQAGDAGMLARYLNPVSMVLDDWPRLTLDAAQAAAVRQGRRIPRPPLTPALGSPVCLAGENGDLYGFGFVTDTDEIAPKRLFARPQR